MKLVKLCLIFMSILFIYNCAHETTINPVISSYQKTDNQGVVISEKKHVVSLAHYQKLKYAKGKTMFAIIVENYGEKPVFISNDNISVIFEGNRQESASKKIELMSYIEVMKDIFNQMSMKSRTIHPSSMDRITSSSNSDYVSVTDGPGNSTPTHNLQMRILMMKMDRNALKYSLQRIVLKPQNILPNDSITGIFVCNTKELKDDLEGNFNITVTIDGEEHKFTFARRLM